MPVHLMESLARSRHRDLQTLCSQARRARTMTLLRRLRRLERRQRRAEARLLSAWRRTDEMRARIGIS